MDELSFALPSSSRAEDEAEVGELTALLERFLRTLRRTDRVLFVRRYWYGDAVKDIAAHVQMSPHSVTVRLSRIREKLTRFAQKEGFIL